MNEGFGGPPLRTRKPAPTFPIARRRLVSSLLGGLAPASTADRILAYFAEYAVLVVGGRLLAACVLPINVSRFAPA